jgi:hypothetical protein
VGAEDKGTLFDIRWFFHRGYSSIRELLYDPGIMNDRPKRMNGTFGGVSRFLGNIQRPLDTVTIPAAL